MTSRGLFPGLASSRQKYAVSSLLALYFESTSKLAELPYTRILPIYISMEFGRELFRIIGPLGDIVNIRNKNNRRFKT